MHGGRELVYEPAETLDNDRVQGIGNEDSGTTHATQRNWGSTSEEGRTSRRKRTATHGDSRPGSEGKTGLRNSDRR
jgi:hypothetical protein